MIRVTQYAYVDPTSVKQPAILVQADVETIEQAHAFLDTLLDKGVEEITLRPIGEWPALRPDIPDEERPPFLYQYYGLV